MDRIEAAALAELVAADALAHFENTEAALESVQVALDEAARLAGSTAHKGKARVHAQFVTRVGYLAQARDIIKAQA